MHQGTGSKISKSVQVQDFMTLNNQRSHKWTEEVRQANKDQYGVNAKLIVLMRSKRLAKAEP